MTELTEQQQRVLKVLERISDQVKADEDDSQMFSLYLEVMLDEMTQNDAFGTEGQCDPRGDQRDERWAMGHVQGVDT